jgi:hypothetical protein
MKIFRGKVTFNLPQLALRLTWRANVYFKSYVHAVNPSEGKGPNPLPSFTLVLFLSKIHNKDLTPPLLESRNEFIVG